MKVNPVLNYTLIIRSQVEYSATTQSAVLRCMLETPATGQRRGFSDVDALLTTLRAELLALQNQLIPAEQEEEQRLATPQAIESTMTTERQSNAHEQLLCSIDITGRLGLLTQLKISLVIAVADHKFPEAPDSLRSQIQSQERIILDASVQAATENR